MELFRLFGSILIDDKDAINSLKNVDKKGEDTGSKFGNLAKNGALIGGAIVGAAAIAGAALGGLAMKAASTADDIDENAQKLGLSNKTYQELGYIMRQNGGDIESFKGGMKKLTNTVASAVGGNKAAADSFSQLGIKIKDANGETRNQEDIMWDSMNALAGMTNQTDKAAMANKLFGKQGAELMPILNGGATSIEEMRKQAEDLGIVLSDDSINAGAKFADTMQTLKDSGSAIFTQIGLQLMPVMQKAADWIIAHMPEIQAVIKTVFGVIGTVVGSVVDIFNQYLLPVIQSVVGWVKDNWGTISTVIGVVFAIVGTVIKTAFAIISGIFSGFGAAIKVVTDIFDAIKKAITGPIEKARDIISGIVDAIKGFFHFNIDLPNIKLPHFAIKPKGWELGDLLKGKIPSLGIDWYANGGIFDSPTIFPTANGFKGVGEAGPEAVTPISTLMDYVRTAVKEGNGNDRLIQLMEAFMRRMLDLKIVLDTGEFVGAIASPMDRELQRLLERR